MVMVGVALLLLALGVAGAMPPVGTVEEEVDREEES